MTTATTESGTTFSMEQLLVAAKGHWPYILEDLVDQLKPALGAPGEHVSCPVHGGSNGFRLFDDYADTGGGICNTCKGKANGVRLIAWIQGTDVDTAAEKVARWLNSDAKLELKKRAPPPRVTVIRDPVKAFNNIAKVWHASLPLAGSIAEKYLENRGIWKSNMSSVLRFHPGLEYWAGKGDNLRKIGVFPCLLAPFRDKDGLLVTLHRIFLTPEGLKAPVDDPKKSMTYCRQENGGAVRLFPVRRVMGVAEGLETALAARVISRVPIWSTLNKGCLERFIPPDHVQHLIIFGDKDRSGSGQMASEILADRMVELGKTVEIVMPTQAIPPNAKGLDWSDVLKDFGAEGFPYRWRNWRP